MRGGVVRALLAAVGLALAVAGCASAPPVALGPPAPPFVPAEYVVQAGDTLEIRFPYHPAHDQIGIKVREDGRVMLPLIGEVQAAGLTPPRLGEAIARRYASELRDPEVVVTVQETVQTGVFIGGEVNRPGFVPYRSGLTAVQAVLDAGGFKDSANREEVVLLQREREDLYRGAKLNLADVIAGDPVKDVGLGPSDVIVVPKSAVAKVNLWVRQYIINNLPFNPSLALSPFLFGF
jgi:polysaccharide export outer membrane protein